MTGEGVGKADGLLVDDLEGAGEARVLAAGLALAGGAAAAGGGSSSSCSLNDGATCFTAAFTAAFFPPPPPPAFCSAFSRSCTMRTDSRAITSASSSSSSSISTSFGAKGLASVAAGGLRAKGLASAGGLRAKGLEAGEGRLPRLDMVGRVVLGEEKGMRTDD